MNFPCTKCSLCCRKVDRHELTRWLDSGDGTCVHLRRDSGECAIYETRPWVCNVDAVFQEFAHLVDRRTFYAMNATACNAMQTEHGLASNYRVQLGDNEWPFQSS